MAAEAARWLALLVEAGGSNAGPALNRFAPGRGHAWLAVDPELHGRMVQAWISGQQLPAELVPETAAWPSVRVQRLLEAR